MSHDNPTISKFGIKTYQKLPQHPYLPDKEANFIYSQCDFNHGVFNIPDGHDEIMYKLS